MQEQLPRGDRYKLPLGEFSPSTLNFKTKSGLVNIEEALYLLEKGQIRLLNNKGEMSIQQVFGMVNLDCYIVYSMLRDAGYRLRAWKDPTITERNSFSWFTDWLWASREVPAATSKVKLTYNVFKPSTKLSSPPDYDILVLPSNSLIPELNHINAKNVLIALVNGSEVQFVKLGKH